jgi:hypothetical protein
MPGERTSVYLAAAVKASGVPLAELVRRGLAAGTAEATQPTAPGPASPSLAALPDGELADPFLYDTPRHDSAPYSAPSVRRDNASGPVAVAYATPLIDDIARLTKNCPARGARKRPPAGGRRPFGPKSISR